MVYLTYGILILLISATVHIVKFSVHGTKSCVLSCILYHVQIGWESHCRSRMQEDVHVVMWFTHYTIHVVMWFTHCTVHVVMWFTHCTVHVVIWFTHCTVHVVMWFTYCTVHVVMWFTHCIVHVVIWFTHCTIHVGMWFTQCTAHVLRDGVVYIYETFAVISTATDRRPCPEHCCVNGAEGGAFETNSSSASQKLPHTFGTKFIAHMCHTPHLSHPLWPPKYCLVRSLTLWRILLSHFCSPS